MILAVTPLFAIYCPPLKPIIFGRIFLINAVLLFLYMTLFFLLARARKRLDTVDTAWGLGFVLVAWSAALQRPTDHSLVIALLVSVWGLRLAWHIYSRSKRKDKDDPRYTELASKWKGNYWLTAYLVVFLLQAVLIWVVSLPVVMATGHQFNNLTWLTPVGVVIWAIGFACEALADKQLKDFLAQQDHPKVMDRGLWRYSRHPNYFGELTQWWAIVAIALQVSWGWVGLIGPLTLTILIVFVSGIPPAEKRRAKDAQYRKYQQATSPLIPLPRKKQR